MSTTKKFSLKIRDYISVPERKREYNEHHFSKAVNRYDFTFVYQLSVFVCVKNMQSTNQSLS